MTEERVALLPRMVTMRDAIEALAEQLAPESARLHAVTPPSVGVACGRTVGGGKWARGCGLAGVGCGG
jgi:hypothetical protein